jgi:hypothetical protein
VFRSASYNGDGCGGIRHAGEIDLHQYNRGRGPFFARPAAPICPRWSLPTSWNDDWTYTAHRIRIAQLILDGNSSASSATNELVIRSWLRVLEDLQVEDLQVENAAADGIEITTSGD